MGLDNLLGLAAGFLTTFSLVPQVVKMWKTQHARDISLGMFVAFCSGVTLWLGYGILLGEPPIILWNAVTLVLGLAIVANETALRVRRPDPSGPSPAASRIPAAR